MMPSLLLALLAGPARALPPDDAPWEVLEEAPVRVECARLPDGPWCRSTGVIAAPVERVARAVAEMRHHHELFDSVLRIDVLEPDVLHVVLDYPAPLDDRDYVARYTREQDGDAVVFRWVPVEHPGAPPEEGVVRLPRFAGEWRLEPDGGGTRVRYTWEAEIAGSFPSFAYGTAWRRMGWESLRDLGRTVGAPVSPP